MLWVTIVPHPITPLKTPTPLRWWFVWQLATIVAWVGRQFRRPYYFFFDLADRLDIAFMDAYDAYGALWWNDETFGATEEGAYARSQRDRAA